MTQPASHLTAAQIERLLAELNQQSDALTEDDLQSLKEFVQGVGGIEAAQTLLDALEELDLEEDALDEPDLAVIDEAVDGEQIAGEEIDVDNSQDAGRAAA